jgi:hypothetical protein
MNFPGGAGDMFGGGMGGMPGMSGLGDTEEDDEGKYHLLNIQTYFKKSVLEDEEDADEKLPPLEDVEQQEPGKPTSTATA